MSEILDSCQTVFSQLNFQMYFPIVFLKCISQVYCPGAAEILDSCQTGPNHIPLLPPLHPPTTRVVVIFICISQMYFLSVLPRSDCMSEILDYCQTEFSIVFLKCIFNCISHMYFSSVLLRSG